MNPSRPTRPLSLVAVLALSALACGTSSSDPAPAPVAPVTPEQDAGGDPPAPPRTLIDGHALPGAAENMIIDPGFSLLAQRRQSWGSFLAFRNDAMTEAQVQVAVDSRSPARFAGGVATLPGDASNLSRIVLLTSFVGGAGPWRAALWVARRSPGDGKALPLDGESIQVTVASESPEGQGFALEADGASTYTAAGRTWARYTATIPDGLTNGGFFLVSLSGGANDWHLAAPELVPEPLLPTRKSLSARATPRTRALGRPELAAIGKYRAIPPRLMPEAPTPPPRRPQ